MKSKAILPLIDKHDLKFLYEDSEKALKRALNDPVIANWILERIVNDDAVPPCRIDDYWYIDFAASNLMLNAGIFAIGLYYLEKGALDVSSWEIHL